MEGSMKTMSWSRYHALSRSLTRTRSHLRGSRSRRTRRIGKAVFASAVSEADGGASRAARQDRGFRDGFPARALRSIVTFFRTGVLPADTDI